MHILDTYLRIISIILTIIFGLLAALVWINIGIYIFFRKEPIVLIYRSLKKIPSLTKRIIKWLLLISEPRKIHMKKKVIDIVLQKKGLKAFLQITVAPEIEEYFKNAATRTTDLASEEKVHNCTSATGISEKWLDKDGTGLEFYLKNARLSNKVCRYTNIVDNFGASLMEGNHINLALLRIVGISSENGRTIQTDDILGYEEMKEYAEKLATWTKAFYEDHIKDQDLSATITFEVEP